MGRLNTVHKKILLLMVCLDRGLACELRLNVLGLRLRLGLVLGCNEGR